MENSKQVTISDTKVTKNKRLTSVMIGLPKTKLRNRCRNYETVSESSSCASGEIAETHDDSPAICTVRLPDPTSTTPVHYDSDNSVIITSECSPAMNNLISDSIC